MNCPVCGKNLTSQVCACGYDASRDYEKYPTFAPVPRGLESVAGLQDRMNDLVRCNGCGGHAFVLNRKTGSLACSGCGRALSPEELKPLTDALGMKKAEPKTAAPKVPAQLPPKNPQSLLNVLGKIQQQRAAEPQVDPRRIVAVSAGYEHTAVLYADGTAAAVGKNGCGECNLSGWRDMVAISAGFGSTTGLKKDGTVVHAGRSYDRSEVSQWRDIVAISEGVWHTVGLKKDGTVVAAGDKSKGRCDVSGWRNIQAISAGDTFTIGLEKSGKVVIAGKGKGTKLPFGGLHNVKCIAAGYYHSVAMSREGYIHILGNGGSADALGTDIVQVDAGSDFTVVRKKDGTAAATGTNYDGRCNVDTWKNLEAVSAGRRHAVGLKKDGTLVATGSNDKGQCDVQKLVRK